MCAKALFIFLLLVVAPTAWGGHKQLTPEDFLVTGLEEVEPSFSEFQGSMYAGLIPTALYEIDSLKNQDAEEGKLMFWLFVPKNSVFEDSLVVWLNGGPGCSSFSGCLFENCPVTIGSYKAGHFGIPTEDPLSPNPYAWTEASIMMYVEQPQGVGFSSGPFPENEGDLSRDFYFFMQNFYSIFEHLVDHKLYFFGESYAGMYVPSIAHHIQQENKAGSHRAINLAGIALGNGWADAYIQGPAVIDYALWHGMIDSATASAMYQEWENCRDGSEQPSPFHAMNAPDDCGFTEVVLEAAGAGLVDWGSPNGYDVTTWDTYKMLDDRQGAIAEFYNNPRVQDALNAPRVEWKGCLPGAGRRRRRLAKDENALLPGKLLLAHDEPISMRHYLQDLLDDDIRVLAYNGDRDLSVNTRGSEMLLDSLEWKGSNGWSDTSTFERGLWLVNENKVGGYVKSYRNLEFVVVIDSGHLVPFNRPRAALDLTMRFLAGSGFADKALPKYVVTPKTTVRHSKHSKHTANSHDGMGLQAIFFVVTGFALGIFFTLRFPKKRPYYQEIPTVEDPSLY